MIGMVEMERGGNGMEREMEREMENGVESMESMESVGRVESVERMPCCDNDCTELSWVEYLITYGANELFVSVKDGTDMEGEFLAFCHDEQEMISVKGWMLEDVERLGKAKVRTNVY